jgi:hypothetical protein
MEKYNKKEADEIIFNAGNSLKEYNDSLRKSAVTGNKVADSMKRVASLIMDTVNRMKKPYEKKN